MANGSQSLLVKPAFDTTRGATFTLQVALAGLQLEHVETIVQEWYLPLLLRRLAPAGQNR